VRVELLSGELWGISYGALLLIGIACVALLICIRIAVRRRRMVWDETDDPETWSWEDDEPAPPAPAKPASRGPTRSGTRAPAPPPRFSPSVDDPPPYRWRTIRVFISSTFSDFHAERDYLVKFVFPELSQWCERYRLHLVDIDLRWGVTAEEAESGKVIDLCLEQIDGSRPFFIGLLGQRYGWVPSDTEIPADTRSRFPGLDAMAGTSITHLEILHAFLEPIRTQEPAGSRQSTPHSFFYFRDPEALPAPDDVEGLTPEGREAYRAAFFDRDDESSRRLADLKETIAERVERAPPLPNGRGRSVFTYQPTFDPSQPNPENPQQRGRFVARSLGALGARVLEDLQFAIGAEFADRIEAISRGPEPERTEVDSEPHDAFLEIRTRLFVGRSDALERLRTYVTSGSDKVLAVFGESGSGKSALLAQFGRNLASTSDGVAGRDVIVHFVGAGPRSTSLQAMLRRLCGELKRRAADPSPTPHELRELETAFGALLRDTERRLVIVIDALDQLDEGGSAHRLDWLPASLSPNVRIVVSSLDEDVLRRKTDEILDLAPLNDEERREIIRRLPSIHCKTLEDRHIDTLLEREETRNPLYLQVAIDELRLFGGYETLGDRIAALPQDLLALFEQVLERLEAEASGVPGLVERLFCLLECSRHGLTAGELEALLPDDTDRVHVGLLRQIRGYLHHRGDLIDFFHRALSRAVRNRYLGSADGHRWHVDLAGFFGSQPLHHDGVPNQRRLTEQPWQQIHSRSMWDEAEETLCDLRFVEAKIHADRIGDLVEDYVRALAVRNTDRLEAFADFVSAQAPIMREHGSRAGFVVQQAINHAATGHVTEAGDALAVARPDDGVHIIEHTATRPAAGGGHVRAIEDPSFRSFAVSPDFGVAVVAAGKRLELWDLRVGERRGVLYDGEEAHWIVGMAADGRRALTRTAQSSAGNAITDLHLWDLERRSRIRTIDTGCTQNDVMVDAALGRAYVFAFREMVCFELETGHRILSGPPPERNWEAVALSADGERLLHHNRQATYNGRGDGVGFYLYAPQRGETIAELLDDALAPDDYEQANAERRPPVRFKAKLTHDGRAALVVSTTGGMWWWDIEAGGVPRLTDDPDLTPRFAVTPDGRIAVVMDRHERLQVREVRSGQRLALFPPHGDEVSWVGVSPDGERALTYTKSPVGTVMNATGVPAFHLWDLTRAPQEDANRERRGDAVQDLEGLAGGARVLCVYGKGGAELWDVRDDPSVVRVWQAHEARCHSARGTPDGSRIVTTGGEEQHRRMAKLWDASAGEAVGIVHENGAYDIQATALTPDGARVLVTELRGTGGPMHLYDLAPGRDPREIPGHETGITDVDITPDGKVAVASALRMTSAPTMSHRPKAKRTLGLFNVVDGERQDMRDEPGHDATAVRVSPDGRMAASTHRDGIHVWDLRSRRRLHLISAHEANPVVIAFTPDGRYLLSGSPDRTLRIHRLGTWECVGLATTQGLVSAICPPSAAGRFAFGTNDGQVCAADIRGLLVGAPRVTAARRRLHDVDPPAWSAELEVCCPWCSEVFEAPARVVSAIRAACRSVRLQPQDSPCLTLQDSAWAHDGLEDDCPLCAGRVRYNPFVVDES